MAYIFSFMQLALTFTFFGCLPVFLVGLNLPLRTKLHWSLSLVLALPLIALWEILRVSLKIDPNHMRIALGLGIVFALITQWQQLISLLKQQTWPLASWAIAILSGIFLWKIFYFSHFISGDIYIDTWWNLAIISEFKRAFPPHYPMWQNLNQNFVYHFLPNIYWAGMSSLSGLPTIDTVLNIGSLFIWILIALVVSAFNFSKQAILTLVIFFALIFIQLNNIWPPLMAFILHLSGSISNFFWGLPLFLGLLFLGIENNKYRARYYKRYRKFPIASLFLASMIAFLLTFTKGSSALGFVAFEFSFLVILWLKNRFFQKENFTWGLIQSLNFIGAPIVVLVTSQFFIGSSTLTTGKTIIRDKLFNLEGGGNETPFILLLAAPMAVFFLLRRKSLVSYAALLAAFLNILPYFYFTHHSHSEVYFIFNSILFIFIFLSPIRWRQVSSFAGPTLMLVLILGSLYRQAIKPISIFKNTQTVKVMYDSYSQKAPEIIELQNLGKDLPEDLWVMVPEATCTRGFYSAALERKTFAECPIEIQSQNPTINLDAQKSLVSETALSRESCLKEFTDRQIGGAVVSNIWAMSLKNSCFKYFPFRKGEYFTFYKLQ